MNRFACVVIVITLLIMLNDVDCHDGSANINTSDQISNEKQIKYPIADKRFAFLPKDRYDNDKIIFDGGDLYSQGTTKTTTTTTAAAYNDQPAGQSMDANYRQRNDTDQQYFSNANGEYQFSLKIPKGVRRIESGEYEKRNGQPVFIIRGFFEHTLNDGTVKLTAYVFDHLGYHDIPVQTETEATAVVDFRPGGDGDCDLAKGEYCIDRKLLNLLVG